MNYLKILLKKNLIKLPYGIRIWQILRVLTLLRNKSFRDLYFQINKNDICLDLGANLGFASLVMWFKGAKFIYSMEPNKEAFFALSKNLEGIKNIRIINKAISSSTKQEKLFLHKSIKENDESYKKLALSQSSSLMANKTNIGKCFYIVDSINFDDLYKDLSLKPNFIKCDIEGGEYIIFKQLIELAKTNKVRKIFVECHSNKYSQFQKDHDYFLELIDRYSLHDLIDTSWH